MKTVEINIILCPGCDGVGHEDKRVNAYDSERVKCTTCNGQGRLRRVITEETFIIKKGE